ncbi:MAG: YIP1 family protein [Candidatus Hodarchaeota archaeon]
MKIIDLLKDPRGFFEGTREEDWKPAFKFFLGITIALAILTPIVNFLGIESTDFSSSYQAQILAYRITKDYLIGLYGVFAYIIEGFLIIAFGILLLLILTIFLHVIFRLLGGEGAILNAWKAVCYGVGPCILGGFLPLISLFAAFYSLMIQFYIGPEVLYKVEESRSILFISLIIALTFIEMFLIGTTVGLF